jgi:hypothetical protein
MQGTISFYLLTLKLTLSSPLAFLLSRNQANIANCQKFVQWISAHRHRLERYPELPPFIVPFVSELRKQIRLICDDAQLCTYRATAARSQGIEHTINEGGDQPLDSNCRQQSHVYVISLV